MTIINAPYIIDELSWKFIHETGEMIPSVTLKVIIDGMDGDTIIVPNIPADGPTKYAFPITNSKAGSPVINYQYICLYGSL